jgi:F-type H+-transporting ATPase subunit epsilon
MLKVRIITPDTTLFEGEATSVTVPGAKGSFQILVGHAPIVSNLIKGKVTISPKPADGHDSFDIISGVVEVNHNEVIVLV